MDDDEDSSCRCFDCQHNQRLQVMEAGGKVSPVDQSFDMSSCRHSACDSTQRGSVLGQSTSDPLSSGPKYQERGRHAAGNQAEHQVLSDHVQRDTGGRHSFAGAVQYHERDSGCLNTAVFPPEDYIELRCHDQIHDEQSESEVGEAASCESSHHFGRRINAERIQHKRPLSRPKRRSEGSELPQHPSIDTSGTERRFSEPLQYENSWPMDTFSAPTDASNTHLAPTITLELGENGGAVPPPSWGTRCWTFIHRKLPPTSQVLEALETTCISLSLGFSIFFVLDNHIDWSPHPALEFVTILGWLTTTATYLWLKRRRMRW